MEKKGYVIQKLGYEYNDETYYRPQDGGGTPVVVLTDEVEAKKKFMELEIQAWRGEQIGSYGYDMSEITSDEEALNKALEAIGVDASDWWDVEIPKTATDDQIKSLIKASNIKFHEIVEVEIEDTEESVDIGPSEEILSVQESLNNQPKKGIFDSVDKYTNPDVAPIEIPENVTIEDIKKVVEETNDDFLQIKEEMKRLRDEARSKVKNFFIKGMNTIFEMYPEVKSVSWNQYTPYFNDGEPCNFWCNVDDFGVNGFSEYSDEGDSEDSVDVFEDGEVNNYEWGRDENGRASTKVYKNPEARSVKIYEAISGFLNQLDKDDYMTMFGDHAEITVRKGQITVEEYDHD